MVVQLIASALLLDFFGCMMPLAWVEDTKAFKVGVFLIWAALVGGFRLMGCLSEGAGGGESPVGGRSRIDMPHLCHVSPAWVRIELGPMWHPVDTAAALAFIDFLVTAVGYVSLLLGTIWLIFF